MEISNMSLVINDNRVCPICGAYLDDNQICSYGHTIKVPVDARIRKALEIAFRSAQIDGSHHRLWVIDQMVRALTSCPVEKLRALDYRGHPYEYDAQVDGEDYTQFVKAYEYGDDDWNILEEKEYEWETGIAP
jgi:hypothetical protein